MLPPGHQAFEGRGFVVCSFRFRPYDSDPQAVPVAYNHSKLPDVVALTAVSMNSVRTLLASLIDYAGLFPPAELQMRAAVPRYAAHRVGPYSWMFGRFVLPLPQLDEFEHCFDGLPAAQRAVPWNLAVLAGRNLQADVKKIVDFNRRRGDEGRQDARIETIDLKVHSLDDIAPAADVIAEPAEAYFEIPIATDPDDWLAAVVAAGGRAKVRTGGVSAELFPTVSDLARFLRSCAAHRVPFRAAGGLHHAIRAEYALAAGERSARVVMHGFLNLFLAACLACTDRVGAELLEAVLSEQSPGAFVFDETGVSVHGRRLSCESLATTRRRFAISYGSCLIEEPIEDLKRLELI